MNLLFVREEAHWIVDMYRGYGVLSQLRHLVPDLNIIEAVHSANNSEDIWKDVIQADAAYFLRTDTALNREIAKMCKIMRKPIWYDIDDDLFNVSPDSTAHKYYRMKSVQDSVEWFLRNSDIVTVSTHHLRKEFAKFRPEKAMTLETAIPVIPNAVDTYTFPDIAQYPEKEPEKRITWRGGSTHKEDLRHYAEEFIIFNAASNDWGLHFWGEEPYWIMKIGETGGERPNMKWSPYTRKFYEYMVILREKVRPFAMAVPLKDTKFNQAKSNIAALEAVYCGAVPIIPDTEEWKPFKGALFYQDRETFGKALLQVKDMNNIERRERWEKNVSVVMEQFALHETNKARAVVLDRLIGRK